MILHPKVPIIYLPKNSEFSLKSIIYNKVFFYAVIMSQQMAQENIYLNIKKANLKKLHKLCKPSVVSKQCAKIYQALQCFSVSSYRIFRKQKTLDWDQETLFLKTSSEQLNYTNAKSLVLHLFFWQTLSIMKCDIQRKEFVNFYIV